VIPIGVLARLHQLFAEFISYLDNGDKEHCVQSAIDWLSDKKLDIVTLYNDILEPALKESFYQAKDRAYCVWEEHLRTSIVRTIIECCYPYVIREAREKNIMSTESKIIVVCPPEELHEIGARMVADFFTLNGYDVLFIGANTPLTDILEVIKYSKPSYVAISVTNHFNLVATRIVIQKVINLRTDMALSFTIIVGGNAFKRNPYLYKEMGADILLETWEDIQNLKGKT
jgi:MerR family transcriptional regulator, light-induced transcriptional regulator